MDWAPASNFEHGYYAAHRHLTAADLDLMVFVGDYIYEGPARLGGVRRHAGGEARTLADYRNRHAQYKTDPDLQGLHAAVPWLVTWDDHEVDNNYAGTRSEWLDPNFARRRAAAYRAYFEHMPLRRRARPQPTRMVLRSRRDWGQLARLHVLDGRQRRTPQACPPPGRGGGALIDESCKDLHARGRTMLGKPQEAWLTEGLQGVPDRWHLIAQQTLMARAAVMVDGHRRVSSDAWDGYPDARDRLVGTVADNGLRSCVVLSSDAHAVFVCDLKRDFADTQAPVIATEFCDTSISTAGRPQSRTDAIVLDNPHILYGMSSHRGYWVVDLNLERCIARLQVIDDPKDRHAGITTAAMFAVDAGRPARSAHDSAMASTPPRAASRWPSCSTSGVQPPPFATIPCALHGGNRHRNVGLTSARAKRSSLNRRRPRYGPATRDVRGGKRRQFSSVGPLDEVPEVRQGPHPPTNPRGHT